MGEDDKRYVTYATIDGRKTYFVSEELYDLYNNYGRGRITETQFIALYLEDKLDDYIEKGKKQNERRRDLHFSDTDRSRCL